MSEQSRLQAIETTQQIILDRLDALSEQLTSAINREQEDSVRKFPGHEQVYYKFTGGLIRTSGGITGD